MGLRSRSFRLFVSLAAFVVAWLAFGTSARASTGWVAPMCDPRGAAVIAPPPQSQDVEMSLDAPDDDCSDPSLDMTSAAPGRAPRIGESGPSQPPVNRTRGIAAARRAADRLPAPVAMEVISRPGFRDSLDRPPRA